jgi:hypothetical protein
LPCATNLDGNGGIDAVLVQQIDVAGLQPAQRTFDCLGNVFGSAVSFGTNLFAVLDAKTELAGEHHLVAVPAQCPPEQFLVAQGSIDLGGVEKCAAKFQGAVQRRERFRLVRRTVGLTHAHAPEADRGYPQALIAQGTLTHSHAVFSC